ncbi:MAG: hypothetical protein WC629_02605 [Candidatus Paceibacterota bacterium]|jgi:hypothetical protein
MNDQMLRTTTRFEWTDSFDENVILDRDFVRLVGEAIIEDSIDGKKSEITLLQANILRNPAYYTSVVMRFCVYFYKYLDVAKTETNKYCEDWIQVIVICNYDTVSQQVIVNKVYSCSRNQYFQFQESSSVVKANGWKNTAIAIFYDILFFSRGHKVIFVRSFLAGLDCVGNSLPGHQSMVLVENKSFPCYISQTDRGLILL